MKASDVGALPLMSTEGERNARAAGAQTPWQQVRCGEPLYRPLRDIPRESARTMEAVDVRARDRMLNAKDWRAANIHEPATAIAWDPIRHPGFAF
jgi:hypothetical protein